MQTRVAALTGIIVALASLGYGAPPPPDKERTVAQVLLDVRATIEERRPIETTGVITQSDARGSADNPFRFITKGHGTDYRMEIGGSTILRLDHTYWRFNGTSPEPSVRDVDPMYEVQSEMPLLPTAGAIDPSAFLWSASLANTSCCEVVATSPPSSGLTVRCTIGNDAQTLACKHASGVSPGTTIRGEYRFYTTKTTVKATALHDMIHTLSMQSPDLTMIIRHTVAQSQSGPIGEWEVEKQQPRGAAPVTVRSSRVAFVGQTDMTDHWRPLLDPSKERARRLADRAPRGVR